MKDSEILERLIYRAYVAPGTSAPMEAAALLPFVAAMRLYAKCYAAEEEIEKKELIAAAFGSVCDGDACTVEYPEPEPVSEPDMPPEPEPDTHTQPGPLTAEQERLRASPSGMEQAKSARSTRS